MSFINMGSAFNAVSENPSIAATGPKTSEIAFIGDMATLADMKGKAPFSGNSGGVLVECLHSNRLIRSNVYITLVVKEFRGKKTGDYLHMRKRPGTKIINGTFTPTGWSFVEELRDELRSMPNLKMVVAMGNLALGAMRADPDSKTAVVGIRDERGYPFLVPWLDNVVCMPTLHPAAAMEVYEKNQSNEETDGLVKGKATSSFMNRYYTSGDLRRALEIMQGRPIKFPRVVIPETFNDTIAVLESFKTSERFAFDIEAMNYEVSCISFCDDSNTDNDDGTFGCTYSIPVHHTWSLEQEATIWRHIAEVLGNADSTKIGQNLIFDIGFLAQRNGIIVRGRIEDLMIAHHIMYHELPKSLNFICSSQAILPSWKSSVAFNNIKADS